MIYTKPLTKLTDFTRLKQGDILAVEWHRDSYKGNMKTRFAVYEVIENHTNGGYYNQPEISLQLENNVYFNYNLFLGIEEGCSNVKSVTLIGVKE